MSVLVVSQTTNWQSKWDYSVNVLHIHKINPSSTNTCKPIMNYKVPLPVRVEVSSTARSKLQFKACSVLHLGATECSGLYSSPCHAWAVDRPCHQYLAAYSGPALESCACHCKQGLCWSCHQLPAQIPSQEHCLLLSNSINAYLCLTQLTCVVNYTAWKKSIY